MILVFSLLLVLWACGSSFSQALTPEELKAIRQAFSVSTRPDLGELAATSMVIKFTELIALFIGWFGGLKAMQKVFPRLIDRDIEDNPYASAALVVAIILGTAYVMASVAR